MTSFALPSTPPTASPLPRSSSLTSLHYSATSNSRKWRSATQQRCLRITASSSLADASALLRAAHHTVDTYVKSGMVIGLGSGQASIMTIEYLGRQLRVGAFKDIVGIPTCVASASEASKAGIPLDYYQDSSQIDFAFDDADVIEEGTLTAIIGRRSLQSDESIIQQKSILNTAAKLVFMISKNKYKGGLDGSIPVLVQSLNWLETAEEIDDQFLGDAEKCYLLSPFVRIKRVIKCPGIHPEDLKHHALFGTGKNDVIHVWRRPAIGQAGPMGGDFPLVTKEGYNVLDVIFTSPIQSLGDVAKKLDNIDGVVDHGVISKFPCTAVIASEDGLSIVDNLQMSSVKGQKTD